MKISFAIPTMRLAGGIKVVLEYANRLQKRGHQVTVVYPLIPMGVGINQYNLRRLTWVPGFLSKKGRIDWFQLDVPWKKALYFPQRFRIPLLERYVPNGDIVVAPSCPSAYFVANLPPEKGEKFYLIQHREPLAMWNESRLWDEAKEIDSDPWKLPLVVAGMDTSGFYFHKLRKRADESYGLPLHKVTISSWLKILLEERFGQKVEAMIINGVNLSQFFNENKQYNGKKRILMLYHDERWKGVEDGIKAFEIARKKHPEVRLVMFGAHRGKNIPSYAEFHEYIYGEDLRKLYCSCDIFLCPSWIEGSQAPPMEAMACKCAVVATAVGGIPDYAIPGETALVSPPRSPELLAENIAKLLKDRQLLKHISEAGYHHIRKFTWDKATEALEQTFSKVLCEKTR